MGGAQCFSGNMKIRGRSWVTHSDESCLRLTEIFDFYINMRCAFGLKVFLFLTYSCWKIIDKAFAITQQDQINKAYIKEMNPSAPFGSDKPESERIVESVRQAQTCGNLSGKSKVVWCSLGEWQKHAEASGLCKHEAQIRANTGYISVLLTL